MSQRSKALAKLKKQRRAQETRVKEPKILPMPLHEILASNAPEKSDMLTRKVTGKRVKTTPRSKPMNYTSLRKTASRGREQSKKRVVHPHYTHDTTPRSLLLDQRRQQRLDNAEERLKPFIWAPQEKPYKITPPTRKNVLQMVTYPHSGWSAVDLENGVSLRNGKRERR